MKKENRLILTYSSESFLTPLITCTSRKRMTTCDDRRHPAATLSLMAAYVVFGVCHELAHLAVASWLLPSSAFGGSPLLDASSSSSSSSSLGRSASLLRHAARAVLGRYSLIRVPASQEDQDSTVRAIHHAGWVCSLILAVVCHLLHLTARRRANLRDNKEGLSVSVIQRLLTRFSSVDIFLNPAVTFAAYITAMEAIATDLLGFVPIHPHNHQDLSLSSHFIICFCGNFGVLLLNPSWLSIDGGRTALDILEKMVNVTMMRGMCVSVVGDIESGVYKLLYLTSHPLVMKTRAGAQSGGVVTFEPDNYSAKNKLKSSSSPLPPRLHGIRSRVVNAKRTDLSKGVRNKVVKDNCERLSGNLRGWDKLEYNTNNGRGQLVRGFFGHTRFATSSKASFDGTHPHKWSERRVYNVYSFISSSSSSIASIDGESRRPRSIGVENYITHNGDFDFFKVNGKFYDVEVVQLWLEKVLGTPMPTTVDSGELSHVVCPAQSLVKSMKVPLTRPLDHNIKQCC
jgi:hypothetical protein